MLLAAVVVDADTYLAGVGTAMTAAGGGRHDLGGDSHLRWTHEPCGDASGGLVLSRDPKPHLKWTPDLHDRFVDAVTRLGGPFHAHPPPTIDYMKELLERIKRLQEEMEVGSDQGSLLSVLKEFGPNEIMIRNSPKFDVERRVVGDTRVEICFAGKPGLLCRL